MKKVHRKANQHSQISPISPGLNDSAVAAYFNLMVESATMMGADRQEAETQMLDVLAFETQLANVGILSCLAPLNEHCN